MYLLLVEDDLDLGNALLKLLGARYRMDWVRNLKAAQAHLEAGSYDLMLLDLGLPDGDGLTWLRDLRRAGRELPVLILSARDALDERIEGLDTGADDYLVKPFEPDELLARIRVLQRRQAGSAAPLLVSGALSFDPQQQVFRLGDALLEFAPMEQRLLIALLQSGGKPVSRERLLQQLYGLGPAAESNTLTVHIHALRRALGATRIETVRGYGYRLRAL